MTPADPGAGTSPQRRVDRIQAFREELAQVEAEIGPVLEPAARERLAGHHAGLLERLRGSFDIDATETERQLSLGMRVASLLGTFAFCAAVFLFFYRHWGRITLPAQVVLLSAGPLLGVGLTAWAARREHSLYFAQLAGAVSCAALVLALEALGRILSLPASPWRYLGWALFGLMLAQAYRFRLVMAATVVSLSIFTLGSLTALTGAWWTGFLSRPEGYALLGAFWVILPALRPGLIEADLAPAVRLTGAVMAFLALLALGLDGNLSLLPVERRALEGLYDAVAVAAGGAGIVTGIRRGWTELRLASTVFVVILLVVKAFDWWWDWLPRELFFLILGLLALGIMTALRRVRARTA